MILYDTTCTCRITERITDGGSNFKANYSTGICSRGSTEHVPHALGDFSTEIVGSTVDMRLDICGIGVSVVWGEPPT